MASVMVVSNHGRWTMPCCFLWSIVVLSALAQTLKIFQKQQHQLVHPFKTCVLAQTAGLLGANLEMTEAGQIYITAIRHRFEVLKLETIM